LACWGFYMKKLAIALTAIAGFTVPASAADMAAQAPMRAPPPVPVASWTGCYVAGGGGYGMYNAESRELFPGSGVVENNQGTAGGRGWMGQAQVGCDYQFAGSFVIGAFGDYTFMDVHGDKIGAPDLLTVGNLKQDSAWAVGGRIGYLVSPTFLSYFSGGYTETKFNQVNYLNATSFGGNGSIGSTFGTALPGATYKGWFLGSGFEYGLGFLSPALYLKTEYRVSEFDGKTLSNFSTTTGLPTGDRETVKPWSQSVVTSLVYRFNWSGAPARY
jgi:outer membrane immunogenic protein